MYRESKQIGQSASYIGRFFIDAADSVKRAYEARELMNRPESYFVRIGTTRESMIRRVFDI